MSIRAGKIDETLKELLVGIFVFEILAVLIGVWFVASPARYILGIVSGMVLAMFSAIHMDWSIRKNLEINMDQESAANAYSVKSSMIRYTVILMVFLAFCLTDVAYPLAVFLGIMGLKAGAYLQPFTHKYLFRKKEEDINKVG